MPTHLHFDHGTLVAPALDDAALAKVGHLFVRDERTAGFRAPAHRYRDVVLTLKQAGLPFVDEARRFEPLALNIVDAFEPFPHQEKALEAWWLNGRRGVVELPTGAGKTLLAVLAIEKAQRPTLVVVPTLELLVQWQRTLQQRFGVEVGTVGGGTSDLRDLTVITYDSAQMQMEFLGNRFGLLVCDECHHLPAPAYRFIAEGSLAPFRLGLSATMARTDGSESVAYDLLGPLVHQVSINELEGKYLAPYEIHSIPVLLDEEEQEVYDASRAEYLQFLRGSGISVGSGPGWAQFIIRAHQSEEGRSAFSAYRRQKRIALTSKNKLDALWQVFKKHNNDRILVFTEDNETVYRISELFVLPTITHQTRPPERKALLDAFSQGTMRILLTSKVLNEGVDVPDANVGIVLSGNGSVREHVQRLGRILRKKEGKTASLYEIYTDVAAESGISERRRQHAAYQRDESC